MTARINNGNDFAPAAGGLYFDTAMDGVGKLTRELGLFLDRNLVGQRVASSARFAVMASDIASAIRAPVSPSTLAAPAAPPTAV